MISEAGAWLIPGIPIASFVLIGLVIRPFFRGSGKISGYVTIGAVGASLALSIWAYVSVAHNGGAIDFGEHTWFATPGIAIPFGIMMDPLTAIMLIVVSGVSLLVQIYSQAYMEGDPGYSRYYAYMSLFTASMLGLVISRSIIQIYVFWELVGLCSYLLIGFWATRNAAAEMTADGVTHRPSPADAAKKAFLMTRLGDFGFLLGILYLFMHGTQYLDLPTLYQAVGAGAISVTVATWVGLGVFAGAVGKSAQFPLHTWLPDAMEGPTPVSALIHAATMVAAGVFLVGRFFPVIELSNTTMDIVALIGGFTALFAATMGLTAIDIKRVFAFSTVSQLGYMFLALGTGSYVAAFFHLFTHAWFKALLFLSSGSVHHASGTFNMRYMGGLKKVMPYTYWATVIAGLALAGIFPFAGFWSKDQILAGALTRGGPAGIIAYAFGLTAVPLTAFYMFRAVFLTFHGEFRGGGEREAEEIAATGEPLDEPLAHGHVHLHESPLVMVGPLVFLSVAAITAGFFANPPFGIGIVAKDALGHFLTNNSAVFANEAAKVSAGADPGFNYISAIVSVLLGLGGIGLAYLMYMTKSLSPEAMGARFRFVYKTLFRKYYFDEVYETAIVRWLFYRRFLAALQWIDRNWIDNVNVRVSLWTGHSGRLLTVLQDGQLQTYGAVLSLGTALIIAIFYWVSH